MKITVVGCGRWGSFIAWYLNRIGKDVTLYGRNENKDFQNIINTRSNGYVEYNETMNFTTDIKTLSGSNIIVISIPSQNLYDFMQELKELNLKDKIFILCMKGLDIKRHKRLSEIVEENTDSSNKVAVWIGPGHVQEFYKEIPNCMVIDSKDAVIKQNLVNELSSDLIRFYIGTDLLGNEIGAASKNVIGIAAGLLDGFNLSTLKGALMSRGTREVARLIKEMGGNELSAYGLCHLGDYEATVFSPHSHNRAFGEMLAKGEKFDKLAEGYYTAEALEYLSEIYDVDMPICHAVYKILYNKEAPLKTLKQLFERTIKKEF